jgi:hypothetical protein
MKKLLLICSVFTAIFLQSCDERITPNQKDVVTPTFTKKDYLTAHSWQFNEVIIRGGGKTQVQFSRPNSIALSSDFATTTITYNADGTYQSDTKKGIIKGNWSFSTDEMQIILSKDGGKNEIYDITALDKENFKFSLTTTKASVGNDDLWALTLAALGLPTTSTDLVTGFAMIP